MNRDWTVPDRLLQRRLPCANVLNKQTLGFFFLKQNQHLLKMLNLKYIKLKTKSSRILPLTSGTKYENNCNSQKKNLDEGIIQ